MLQSDHYRIRTQPESQVDGSSSFKNQGLPPRSTPNAVGSIPMYSRSEPGRFVSYPTSGLPTSTSSYRTNEERGTGPPSRHRMSLLHPPPQSLEYMMPQIAPRPDRPSLQQGPLYGNDSSIVKLNPMTESPPCKKLRLGETKPDFHSPLRIDTDRARSGPAYNPQVEAISPTLPSESLRDESPLKSTKEELLQQISRVDREIAKTESQIAKLKKKKVELEEASTQPQRDPEDNSNASDSVIRSLPQSLYADNRKKANEAHHILDKLGPKVTLPLYNQPSDTAVYQENKIKYSNFKCKLQRFFKIRLIEKNNREECMAARYSELSSEFAKKLEKLENNSKRRAKEAKNREIFEKVFPELRKQREDKERFSRVGSRIKSDADLEEIMDGLHEQEMEDKKMRSYAVIPPIILDERTRKLRFRNSNGLIEEPMQEYKDKQLINLWTDQEKDIFKEKYLQHPKNFGIIKSYLERKGVADCVQYYYLSKKAQNYRQLLRKNRARTRSSRNQQQNNHAGAPIISSSLPGLPTVVPVVKTEPNGVTTRLQKEQKLDQLPSGAIGGVSEGTPGATAIETNNADDLDHPFDEEEIERCNVIEDQNQNPPTLQGEYIGQAKKKRKDDHKDALNQLDTSDEENLDLNGDRGGPHNCVVCKIKLESYLQSRPLVRSQASQYGVVEEDIQPGDRVCSSCRCKAVRRRYKPSQCPIPTCPARRARVKRLRPFPPKWADLTQETRDAISAKYQIPANVTKCCTACFNRINRRLSPNASLDTPDDPSSDTTSWTEEEIDSMKKALTELGTDWRRLSEEISTKSDLQCRNFYFNFRKKFGLDTLVQEFRKSRGGDGPPILTDEEESGSTTSSCDEGVNHSQDHNRNSVEKKDDYDSSATVSAEEGSTLEPEKPQTIDSLKTLPSNPADIPLQLTVRPNNIMNPMQDISQHGQRQVLHTHHSQHQHSQHHNLTHSDAVVHHTQSDHEHQIPVSQHLQTPVSLSNRGSSPHGPHHPHISLHPGSSNHSHAQLMPHSHQQEFITTHGHHNSSIGRYPSPEVSDSHEPMTVKDLMLATIERQLRKNPVPSNQMNHSQTSSQGGAAPGPSVSPTIQSILKSQDRSHISQQSQSHILISCSQASQSHGTGQGQPPVISHFQSHPLYYGSKMDNRTIPAQHVMVRENHALLQMQQSIIPPRDEYETLDLSMKKRTPSPQVSSQRPPSNGPPPAHQPLDFAPRQDMYYPKYPISRPRQPQQPIMSHSKTNKVPPPPPLLTKPTSVSPMKDGSITQGTPLHVSQTISSKYEGLLRPLKEGSITQGTPLDKLRGKEQMGNPYAYERSPEYYKRMSPASYSFHSPHPQHYQRPPSSGQRSSPPSGPHPSSYSADQHNASRQIIINDYYTSQQMQQPPPPHIQQQMQGTLAGQVRLDLSKRGMVQVPVSGAPHVVPYMLPPRHEVSYRQSPTPPQALAQQRQGVIHRVNPHRTLIKPESGRYQQHDAFASLVDIAAAQPSLPVPKEDSRPRLGLPRVDVAREGLGKSMAEMERNRLSSSHGHPHGMPAIYRPPAPVSSHNDPTRNRKEMMEPTRFSRETQDTTLTAASLIDAIITHQINQPSQLDGQPPVPTSRTGDRLFASFQRSVQQPIPQSHFPQLQGHSTQILGHSHHEEIKMEDPRGLDKSSQGSSSSGISSGIQQGSAPNLVQSSQGKAQEDMGPYISWKLRRALQHEKEQQQLPNHPDERHIIRVVQSEQQCSRTPSKEINYPFCGGEEPMDTKDSMPGPPPTSSSQSSSSDHYSNKNKPREGISPLDYVKNRIMEVMRTENNEEKQDETRTSPEPNSQNNPVVSTASSHQKLSSNSSIPSSGHSSLGSSAGLAKDIRPENASRSDFQKEEKAEDESAKSLDIDSPTPMVIDESGCDNGEKTSNSNDTAGGSSRNHPNYEPLTDEES